MHYLIIRDLNCGGKVTCECCCGKGKRNSIHKSLAKRYKDIQQLIMIAIN